jgi:hypothetical protein
MKTNWLWYGVLIAWIMVIAIGIILFGLTTA